MFSHKFKDFIIKNSVKKRLSNVKHIASTNSVQTIGIIFDESQNTHREKLMNEIKKWQLSPLSIEFIVFKDRVKKTEVFDYSVFSNKDITWNASFTNAEVNQFSAKKFDLLISYYDEEKAALLLLTQISKANFKVGFSSVDHRLNHFLIQTEIDKSATFAEELFKYLKILKKI
ncbi:MAG: hypothetical protein J0L86_12270 [Flavobacteriales bacterium]|nr:hypothetical protein [Flavobacteriales bacterium]